MTETTTSRLVVRTSTGLLQDPDWLVLVDLVDRLAVGEQISLRTPEAGLNVLRPDSLHWQLESRDAGDLAWEAETVRDRHLVRQRVLDLGPAARATRVPVLHLVDPSRDARPQQSGAAAPARYIPSQRSGPRPRLQPTAPSETVAGSVPVALGLVADPGPAGPAIVPQDLRAELASSLWLLAAVLGPIGLVILAMP